MIGELAVAGRLVLLAERESPNNQASAMTPTRVLTASDREGHIWNLFGRQHALLDQVGTGTQQHWGCPAAGDRARLSTI